MNFFKKIINKITSGIKQRKPTESPVIKRPFFSKIRSIFRRTIHRITHRSSDESFRIERKLTQLTFMIYELELLRAPLTVSEGRFVQPGFNQLVREYGKVCGNHSLDIYANAVKNKLQPLIEKAVCLGHHKAQKYWLKHYESMLSPDRRDTENYYLLMSCIAEQEIQSNKIRGGTYTLLKAQLEGGDDSHDFQANMKLPKNCILAGAILSLMISQCVEKASFNAWTLKIMQLVCKHQDKIQKIPDITETTMQKIDQIKAKMPDEPADDLDYETLDDLTSYGCDINPVF